jgi:hypothetical protein
MAQGCYNLGNVISTQQGDLVKAESLVREAYRIRVHLYGNDHYHVGLTAYLLANVLLRQNKDGDETKQMFECYLATTIRNEGPDGKNTASGNISLGCFYMSLANSILPTSHTRKENLCLAKSCFKEVVRIYTTLHGSTHPQTTKYKSYVSNIEIQLLKA